MGARHFLEWPLSGLNFMTRSGSKLQQVQTVPSQALHVPPTFPDWVSASLCSETWSKLSLPRWLIAGDDRTDLLAFVSSVAKLGAERHLCGRDL